MFKSEKNTVTKINKKRRVRNKYFLSPSDNKSKAHSVDKFLDMHEENMSAVANGVLIDREKVRLILKCGEDVVNNISESEKIDHRRVHLAIRFWSMYDRQNELNAIYNDIRTKYKTYAPFSPQNVEENTFNVRNAPLSEILPRFILLCTVVGPHGFGGVVRTKTYIDDPREVASYGPVSDLLQHSQFELQFLGLARGGAFVRIAGVESREAAEELRGLDLYVSRKAFAAKTETTSRRRSHGRAVLKELTDEEKAQRLNALESSRKRAVEARARAEAEARQRAEDEERTAKERAAAEARAREQEERKRTEIEARHRSEEAAERRLYERERRAQQGAARNASARVVRDVIVPETITVQELANRMAARGVDVVKSLMKMGVMATIDQVIDADTAELVVSEFGRNVRRVAESDVEIGLAGADDDDGHLQPRPPVVTIMGHVDHGKTSLLDALRKTDIVSGEAGGITQHIGAYQVTTKSHNRITFIDTPGHAAFIQMRARGAQVTDIVILVVAADDSIMPQTIEAIRHAKAAEVPMIVAINKCDLPNANPEKVRQELLQHEIVVESMGGDVQAVEVSAKSGDGLDELEEAISLQAELLELKANPARPAEGVVVEAKLERGRGPVATVLVQRGTLRVGDIFVVGSQWGRVRALVDDRAENVTEAEPAFPVEVLGLQGTPEAGDTFHVVENEARAREISDYRQKKDRDARAAEGSRGTLEQMFASIKAGEAKDLPVVVKADVQGSVEAIVGAAQQLSNEEVQVRMLHAAVGGINESDITLAAASKGIVLGFNVRANKQARDLSARDGVDIRYYSVIYDIIDDLRSLLTGMLAPKIREDFLGNAEILQVFNITKVGKVAGCRVTEGMVRRGSHVRLLRDDVVIHEGRLSTLKRFKDEVRAVRQGSECGMAFENYQDLQAGDVIECFDLVEQTFRRQESA